ncbi:hypothetical protein [Halobacillus litoralis]|uniref:hypothetical protein n=1 Tax=Halobacillus litoralis TaxID=45668 RepID=UPI001CD3C9CE|nr:hypothetical protein [Halobacillus litoralis]MCA1021660.1 hypothetical protein [Halobacillus litoralis]
MGYLNRDKDSNGKDIHTSARNDGNGNPITDVFDKQAHDKLDALLAKLNDKIDTQLTGSLMEHAGNSLSDAPDPSSVPVGAEFTDVDAEIIYKNTGTEWKQWVVL